MGTRTRNLTWHIRSGLTDSSSDSVKIRSFDALTGRWGSRPLLNRRNQMRSKALKPRHFVPLLGVAATAVTLLASPAMASPAPAQAPVTGGIPLVDSDERIGPGIDLRHVNALAANGWYDAQYLTVDLTNGAVSTDLLTSGAVASGGPLSVSANKAGAVAGVNGEFFDIGNSNAALGGEIQ